MEVDISTPRCSDRQQVIVVAVAAAGDIVPKAVNAHASQPEQVIMARSSSPVAGIFIGAMLAILCGATSAWSQASAPSQQEQGQQAQGQTTQQVPPLAPHQDRPPLFSEVGKLFDKLPSILPPPGSAGDVGESLARLARPSIMETGRVGCPVSAGGVPDCKLAANQLCQSKGYKEGKSLNTDATEKCSPKVFIPGRQRKPDDCHTDAYVTQALCQ